MTPKKRISLSLVVFLVVSIPIGFVIFHNLNPATLPPGSENPPIPENTPPTAPVASITPYIAANSSTLNCSIISPGVDIDGDPITYSYEWFVDDTLTGLNGTCVLPNYTDVGEVWKCAVTPFDGKAHGPSGNASILIQDVLRPGHIGVFASDTEPQLYDVFAHLNSTGLFINVSHGVNVQSWTPSLNDLLAYDAVIIWSYYNWDGTALGDVLADYIDLGGGVVICIGGQRSSSTQGIAGRMLTGNYLPITTSASYSPVNNDFILWDLPSHPIANNVNSFNGTNLTPQCYSILKPDSTLVAEWSITGRILVATRELLIGRVVFLGCTPVSYDTWSYGWDSLTDGAILMANMLDWAAQGG